MPNHKSADKRVRQSEKRRVINRSHRTKVRTYIKKVRTALESGSAEQVQQVLERKNQMEQKVGDLEKQMERAASEMRRDERVFVIGEDVGVYGGAFKVTLGFQEEFGPWRVIDAPLAETAIVGACTGAGMMGMRPVAEMQFADFISCAWDQLVTIAAKQRWRNISALFDLVVRITEEQPDLDLAGVMAEVANRARTAGPNAATSAVTLLTLHKAKGSEFDAVCLVGLEDGLVPITYAATAEEIAEERRMAYARMTPARHHPLVWGAQAPPGRDRPPLRRRPPRVPAGLLPPPPAAPALGPEPAGGRAAPRLRGSRRPPPPIPDPFAGRRPRLCRHDSLPPQGRCGRGARPLRDRGAARRRLAGPPDRRLSRAEDRLAHARRGARTQPARPHARAREPVPDGCRLPAGAGRARSDARVHSHPWRRTRHVRHAGLPAGPDGETLSAG